MSKVVAIMSMSLDGYVADLNDGVAEVFDWSYLSLAMSLPGLAEPELDSCPVTLPEASPVEVPGEPTGGAMIWYGSPKLAVWLPSDGNCRNASKRTLQR
jgi:hypothetical protein